MHLKQKSTKPEVVKWTLGEAPKLDPLENISGFAPAQKLSLPTSNHDSRIGSASIVLDSPIKDTTFVSLARHTHRNERQRYFES